MNAALQAYLAACDSSYCPEHPARGVRYHAMGYHSRMPDGAWVHPTRDALDYALALLQAGAAAPAARAAAIIANVLRHQDTDPFSKTYGIWPWFMEEPLAQMNPPDWNWADFCGARLAQMLAHHAGLLPAEARCDMRASLGHAAWAIFRRNVHLEYTNIAIMGAGVAAAAGELLAEPRLLEFGRERLRRVIALAQFHGSFTEYNSPTYTLVVLEECERILHVCRDAGVRDAAEHLRRTAWQLIAAHFHPGTQQWAGPHSRAYSDYLGASAAQYVSAQTGVPVAPHPAAEAGHGMGLLVPPLPCPESCRARFAALPSDPCEIRTPFVKLKREQADTSRWLSTDGTPFHGGQSRQRYDDRVGTTWFTRDACLGSINHDDVWYQRRALLGYWRRPDGPAAVLRLRFLREGKDFASALLRNAQSGPRVLSAFALLTDRGDYHPFFDHPKDDVFHAEDFRLRYELRGPGVRVEPLGDGRHALVAGERRAVVHTAPGRFGPHAVRWETAQHADVACVDGICYQGAKRGFNLAELGSVQLAGAVELLGAGEAAGAEPIEITAVDAAAYRAAWSGLVLTVPATADVYPQ